MRYTVSIQEELKHLVNADAVEMYLEKGVLKVRITWPIILGPEPSRYTTPHEIREQLIQKLEQKKK